MITVKINTESFDLAARFKQFISPEGQGDLLRAVSLSMLPVVHDRIHVRGEDAAGGQIGTYSPSYLKYTRPKYGRGTDPKVILSLTRKMGGDFKVVAENDKYGLGFSNSSGDMRKPGDYEKAQLAEITYKKSIYALQNAERDLAITLADDYTNAVLQ